MAIISILLVFCVATLIVLVMKKNASGIKLMLLGISVILFGGILVIDPNTNIEGIEYLIILVGLVLSIMGFGKKDWS